VVGRPRSTDGLIAVIEMAEGKREGWVPAGVAPAAGAAWAEVPPTPDYSGHYDTAPPLPPGDYSPFEQQQPTVSSSRLEVPGAEFDIPPLLPARRSPTPRSQTEDKGYPADSKSDPPYTDAPPAYSDDEDITIGDNRSAEKGKR